VFVILLIKTKKAQARNNMANTNRKKDLDATQSKEYLTPEEQEKKLLEDRLEFARRKERGLIEDQLDAARRAEEAHDQFKKEQVKALTEAAKQKGSLRRFRETTGPEVWEKLSPSQMQEELSDIEKEAARRAMLRLGEKEAEITPYSSKFKGSGAQGEFMLGKLRDIGIDVDNLSEEQVNSKLDEIKRAKEANKPYTPKLTQMQDTGSSRPVFTEAPMVGETPGEYDISRGEFKTIEELNQPINKNKGFQGLKSTLKSGTKKLAGKLPAGLGVATAVSALSEGDLPEAVLGAAEMGLGVAGRGVSRFAPGLDLLRPTSIAPEEEEEEELKKLRFDKLNRYLKQKGLSSEVE